MADVKWQYKIVSDRGKMHRVTVEEMNQLGGEGWELVHIMPDGERPEIVHFYFKRMQSGAAGQ